MGCQSSLWRQANPMTRGFSNPKTMAFSSLDNYLQSHQQLITVGCPCWFR